MGLNLKKGGGFLNNVDATFVGYEWTDKFNGEDFVPGKIASYDDPKKMIEKPHTLNFVPRFRVDGAEEDVTVTLKAASDYDLYEVSDDGLTLTSADGGACDISANSAAGKLLGSFISPTEGGEGFPESALPEDPNSINLESLIGTRVKLVQRVDEERTKKFGMRKNKKTGKEYKRQDLVVAEVLSLPEGGDEEDAAPASKPNGKASKQDETEAIALDALRRYLSKAKGNALPKEKIRMSILTDAAFKGDKNIAKRDAVVKWIYDDANLEGVDFVSYSRSDKSKMVTLSE